MNVPSIRDTDVLIVGAGPTGLVLALWLTRLGVRVRIVDKTAEPGTTSRALAVQARTLELYSQIGLADAVVERGRKALAANLWVAGKQAARAVFGDMGAGLSPFPYALIFPQDEHERLLIDRLAEAGVRVERRTELLGFEDAAGRVRRSSGGAGWSPGSMRGRLHCGVRRRPFQSARGAGDRFPGRDIRASLLCRRRGGERSRDERRTARRPGQDRFSRRLPAERRTARARSSAPCARKPSHSTKICRGTT